MSSEFSGPVLDPPIGAIFEPKNVMETTTHWGVAAIRKLLMRAIPRTPEFPYSIA